MINNPPIASAPQSTPVRFGATVPAVVPPPPSQLPKWQHTFDYSHFPTVGSLRLCELPASAVSVLFFGFILMSRLFQAVERAQVSPLTGKKDYSEVGDVLYRDLPALTFFLAARNPLMNSLSHVLENLPGPLASGVELMRKVEKDGKRITQDIFSQKQQLFTHRQLEEKYYIYNGDSLRTILTQHEPATGKLVNLKGFKQALDTLDAGGNEALEAKLKEFVQSAHTLAAGVEEEAKKLMESGSLATLKESPKVKALAEAAYQKLHPVQEHQEAFMRQMAQGFSYIPKSVSNALEKTLKGTTDYRGFLSRYAKVKRLPVDIIVFSTVCSLIGWLPVKFNTWRNNRKFSQLKAQQQMSPQPPVAPSPTPTPQPFHAAMGTMGNRPVFPSTQFQAFQRAR